MTGYEFSAAGIYDVQITVPGEMTWIMRQHDSFKQRMAQLPPESLRELPAVGTTRTDEGSFALRLKWVNLPAENAWAAIAKAAAVTASELPEVSDQAVDARFAAEIQDPDTERRRPRGA